MAGSPDKPKNVFTMTEKIFKKFKKRADATSSPAPVKVAVFGATGPTGQHLLAEGIARGLEVVAFVRDPGKLKIQNERLQIVKVDIFNEDELVPFLTGCDAVVSALGATGISIFSKVTLYQDSIKSITSAMRKAAVTRLVCMTSWYTESEADSPRVFQWFVKPFIFGRILASMAEMEKYLMSECDDITFTIVRPPMLQNNPSIGEEVKVVEGQFVPESSAKIGRQDVARFMVECLAIEDWDRKAVAVSM